MADQIAKKNFLREAIKGLSVDHFDEFIKRFLKNKWYYEEVVNVDGTNDGGRDLIAYLNKREVKRYIQLTTQKENLKDKITSDLEKANKRVHEEGYPNTLDFFTSQPVSQAKVEEYTKLAAQKFNIILEIYDVKRLCQIECKEAHDFIYELHDGIIMNPKAIEPDQVTKSIYDILAKGNDTFDIKNGLLISFIILSLYEKGEISITELQKEVEKKTGLQIPDMVDTINKLKSKGRIININREEKIISLSEEEKENVKDILAESALKEKEFFEQLRQILESNGISYKEEFFDILKGLYAYYYNDPKVLENDVNGIQRFNELRLYISKHKNREVDANAVIGQIWDLCKENDHINKLCASENFLNLYKSDKLQNYNRQRPKEIFLDTPIFVYLLCRYYGVQENDWDNSSYNSVKSLLDLYDDQEAGENMNIHILNEYINEVAGEIRKALIIGEFEILPDFEKLGQTRNTLYNYFLYLKKNDLFVEDEKIESIADFVSELGFENINPYSHNFQAQTYRKLVGLAQTYGIYVINKQPDHNFADYKKEYEVILLKEGKDRTHRAVVNDVNQMILALTKDTDGDTYFTTWDSVVHLLRDKMLETAYNPDFKTFYIYNPSVLSNKLALESFNPEHSSLSNEVFAYADKEYDMSGKMRDLVDQLLPFLNPEEKGSRKLVRKLGYLRDLQLKQVIQNNEPEKDAKALPVEEVFSLLIPSKEMAEEDAEIWTRFKNFLSSEENTDYIMEVIENMLAMKDFKSFDLKPFFAKVKETGA